MAGLLEVLFRSELDGQTKHLSSELQELMRASLGGVVLAIQKKCEPGYTNVAILGASVCVVAGKLFDDAELLASAAKDSKQWCDTSKHTAGSANTTVRPTRR